MQHFPLNLTHSLGFLEAKRHELEAGMIHYWCYIGLTSTLFHFKKISDLHWNYKFCWNSCPLKSVPDKGNLREGRGIFFQPNK